jgi:salicylate hydroxylase
VSIRSISSGRLVADLALGPAARERFSDPYLVIARADLHALLLDSVRSLRHVRLLVGRRAVALRHDSKGAEVETETGAGRDQIRADLVIGADGTSSFARGALGDFRQPGYSGFVAHRALLPLGDAPDGLDREATGLWLGRGRHVVHYPVASGRLLNVVVVERRTRPVEGWSFPDAAAGLSARFARAASPLRGLVGQVGTGWSTWSLVELPAQTMGSGRVALAGDAAHPVLPYLAQGGALAIEDAAELAAQLRLRESDVPRAVAGYNEARLSRVQRVQREAKRNGRIYHAGWPVSALRNVVLGRLGPVRTLNRYGWLYAWRPTGSPST